MTTAAPKCWKCEGTGIIKGAFYGMLCPSCDGSGREPHRRTLDHPPTPITANDYDAGKVIDMNNLAIGLTPFLPKDSNG